MLEGADISPLADEDVRAVVADLGSRTMTDAVVKCLAPCRNPADEPLWLLLHADAGVTWGVIEKEGVRLSSLALAGWPTPALEAGGLQQLRIFGAGGEVLIWRAEDPPRSLAGRRLADGGASGPLEPWLKPGNIRQVVAASRVAEGGEARGGFTAVADGTGRTQVVPWTLTDEDFDTGGGAGPYPLELVVREYFEQDDVSGCVRVAASRLVALRRREA
jgi:CRISPR-associated protein (TIGR03984 family)